MTILITAFILLALEEFLYRFHRGSSYREADLAGSWTDIPKENIGRPSLFMRWVRMAQLICFGVIFAIIATSAGFGILLTVSGQLSGLLLLLQIVRILTRKVINKYAVLYVVVFLQFILLLLLLVYGLDASGQLIPSDRSMDWLMSALAFTVLFQLSVAFSFSCTYIIRYFSVESSPLFFSMPPLAFSEFWSRRLVRTGACTSVLTMLLQAVLFACTGYPIGSVLLQIVLVGILIAALHEFSNRRRLHHPVAMTLTILAWLLNMVWALAGFSATSANWFA